MSTVGKICLVLTLLLLLVAFLPIPSPWGGWTPRLLVIHNEWSTKIRDAKEDIRKKRTEELAARLDLMKAANELEALAIGWDKVWRVQPGQIRRAVDGTLTINNLGSAQGIQNGTAKDDGGADQTLQPVIHAFYGGGESGSTYVGEFKATTIQANSVVLKPVHAHAPADVNLWDLNAPWRLRSIIPAASRSDIDELFARKVRIETMRSALSDNTTKQTALRNEAQKALYIRKRELSPELVAGDVLPAGLEPPEEVDIPGRPEFKRGLLAVSEDEEEQRDQLLLEVDRLRRAIKLAGEERDANVQALNAATQSLPGASTEYDKLSTPKVASGK